MSFGGAIGAMKAGQRVTRPCSGRIYWLNRSRSAIVMDDECMPDGFPCRLSNDDMLADDWTVVGEMKDL